MSNGFNDLGISAPILQAIEEMGFEQPTEVQSRAIPHILKKEDLIVMSKTGSGKTAVFGVSMLQLMDPALPGPQGLILTPTRELAVQVDSDLKLLAKHLPHKTTAIYGQHSMNTEIRELKNGITIVTGTPGRVFDHIRSGTLQTKHIRFLVLDEADRMLDMGFLDQVMRIIRTIPKDRVTLLFSATIPPEVRRICSDYMKNPEMIEIQSQTKTVDTISQIYYRVAHNEKNTQLNRLLLVEQPESCLIFCNTRIGVDRIQNFLTRKGYSSEALHGEIPQGRRLKTIDQFKQGEFHILVATDVAARGIHVDNLSLVINYDVPVEKDSYIHRIGRTGRAGNIGRSLTLVTSEDIMGLYAIEEHIGVMIEEGELPSEEVFRERSAAAEEWLKANALKARPAAEGAASEGTGAGRRRQGGGGAPGQGRNGRQRDRQRGERAGQAGQEAGRTGAAGNAKAAGQSGQTSQAGNASAQGRGERPQNRRRPNSAGNAENASRTQDGAQPGNGQNPRSTSNSGGRNNTRTPYNGGRNNTRAPYEGEKPGERTGGGTRAPYAGNRTGEGTGSSTRPPYAGRNADGPRGSSPGGSTTTPRAPYAGKPAQPLNRPTTPSPAETGAGEKKNAPAGSSLLKRIVNRLFGK